MADPFGYKARWGYYTDTETGLLLLTHRYYDPGTGRFLTRDPIGYAGGINIYAYTSNNPVNGADPLGLDTLYEFQLQQRFANPPVPPPAPAPAPIQPGASIYVCSRLIHPPMNVLGANHSYLYDSRNGQNCGLSGPRFSPLPFYGSAAPEAGPLGGDPCRPVQGSSNPALADIIMNNCMGYAGTSYIPGVNDCHNLVDYSITSAGLANPGAPGGRFGDRCVSCPPLPPPPRRGGCWGGNRWC
ncbi:MAG: RHS repeat-associated core domain-containing protein [Acidobacteria bacterium]|nr:RHS repeat-associated core domain-containing protein [Acidobacteriota bacterium]